MKSMSIIGLGRFGKVLAGIMKDSFSLTAYDKKNLSAEAKKIGIPFVPLDQASQADVVVLAVPIGEIENACKEISPLLKSGTLVMDTCSVKEHPLQKMKELLPESVEILGTHPLFGPDSVHDKKAWRIALCPARTSRLDATASFLKEKGFTVIVTSPEEHDKQVAQALNVPHLIGHALANMGFKDQEIKTLHHDRLLEIMRVAKNDSEELFTDMNKHNRYAREAANSLAKNLKALAERLK